MNNHQHLISELESQLLECEIMGGLSADPAARFKSREQSITLRARIALLRKETEPGRES